MNQIPFVEISAIYGASSKTFGQNARFFPPPLIYIGSQPSKRVQPRSYDATNFIYFCSVFFAVG